MKIIGAGLSGLLAGCLFPGSTIYEKQSQLPNNHGAILRFRSPKIGEALGIPFKKVRVYKEINYTVGGTYYNNINPTPQIQNMYSFKVTGEYRSRSIGNIDPVDRWIAPDNFIDQLAERCHIEYDSRFPYGESGGVPAGHPVISTIPMPVMLKLKFHSLAANIEFKRRPIWTRTFTFDDSVDLYQTIYFPGNDTYLYRASFTGNRLICEYVRDPAEVGAMIPIKQFGLESVIAHRASEAPGTHQEYGKIIDIDSDIRKSIMRQLTVAHNIYSLGRFATWRNILLDDVWDDIHRIREMTRMDSYSRDIALSEGK